MKKLFGSTLNNLSSTASAVSAAASSQLNRTLGDRPSSAGTAQPNPRSASPASDKQYLRWVVLLARPISMVRCLAYEPSHCMDAAMGHAYPCAYYS